MVDSGNSPGTVSTKQNCLIKFLQHYEGRTRADPDAIHVFDKQGSKIDPADMLSEGEFHAMRTAPEHPRDRALVNFFMYTGQRNTAVRTLRVKDVNLDEGTYRLNTEADGLKGADKVAMWNPLLGATKPIRDWLNHHPAPEDGDAYLFTERHDHRERDPYSTISDDTVNWVLRNAAERAAEEHPAIENKPTHSHAMRHNFVTMCKLRYDMDNDTIKRLIRHKPDSTVMETTYAHLSDADYIQKAEQAFGIREEDDSTEAFDHSPEFCDVCDEPLQRGAKACPACGTLYAPDARSAQSDMQADAESAIVEVDNEAEARIVQSVLEDLREEPGDYLGED
jgi:site-specific recombinase XerD